MEDPSIFPKKIKIHDDLDSDPDNIIVIQESSNMQLGTGSRIWECGMILAKYFIKQNLDGKINLKNKRILELGGGTGFLSIVLASSGANVCCTDLKEILPLMQENIENNKEIIEQNHGIIKIKELDWEMNLEQMKNIVGEDLELDYIVAADVVFNKGHLKTLSNCLQNLVEIMKENTKKVLPLVYLCYKSRNEDIDNEIVEDLEKIGFEGYQVSEEEMNREYINKRVDIFSLIYKGK